MDTYTLLKYAFAGAAVVMIIIGIACSGGRKRSAEKFVEQFKREHKYVDGAAGVMVTEAGEVIVNRDTTFKMWNVKDIAYVNYDTTKNSFNNPRRYVVFLDADKNILAGQLFAPKGKVEAYQSSDYICVVGDNQIRDIHGLLSRHNTYIKLLKDGAEQF
ncbi:hypothetical protein B0O40_2253 [Ruminococcaceae bacterium R-25]|nr:hypothetical protein B0O40_2253 [Ruminococcaceae bacterium R-25]SUQ22110.1 hypothetical protein SAMN06297423_2253 [Oscillospiraceae bacterium]